MARDYKRNERTASPASSKKESHPMLAGILIGLFIGLAAAIGVAIYINKAPTPFVAKARPVELLAPTPQPTVQSAVAPEVPYAPPPPPGAAAVDKGAKPPEKQRFEFYDILQGKEAPATEQDLKAAAAQKSGDKPKENYYLQTGAFKTDAEADNMKAKLALLGLEAVIQTADIPDRGVWHRVRVGPYTSVDELNKARETLSKISIQASLIKIRE